MGILEALIYIIFLLLPFGELARINLGNNIVLHPIDIIIFVLVIYWLILQLLARKDIKKNPDVRNIAFFILICILSLAANAYWLKINELFTSLLYLLRWLSYYCIYLVVKNRSKYIRDNIIRILIIDGIIVLGLGFFQMFYFSSMEWLYRFGWDKHMFRLYSVFLDPNYTGAFLVLYLLLVVYSAIDKFKNKKYIFGYIYSFIGILALLGILLTYSRSALLMFITSGIMFLILIKKKKLITILIGIIVLYIIIISPRFYVENTNLFRVNSSKERLDTALTAVQIITRNPVLGIGFNSYRYAQIKYRYRNALTPNPSHADSGADNSLLFIAATTGLAGLVSYLYFWYATLKKLFRENRKKLNYFTVMVLSSAAGLFIDSQFVNSLFYWPLMLWLWAILGITG